MASTKKTNDLLLVKKDKKKPEDDWRTYPANPEFEINGKGQLRTKGYQSIGSPEYRKWKAEKSDQEIDFL